MANKIKNTSDVKGENDKEASPGQSSSFMPSISVPKGGGAIRGIGEKFGINPVTGTGSLSVPIFTSPGRSGFGPQLSLSYDSGSGNGPFGFGWSLSLPSITRKTDKGLPKYLDSDESDEFILSGAEDLVPVFKKDLKGNWVHNPKDKLEFDEEPRDGYVVRRYLPRIEGLFARIERWTRESDGDVHWRSISKDNILTVYGRDEQSRIFDPSDKRRVFSWLICESYDDKGNAIIYEYKAENDSGIDLALANESNRLRTANRYIKRISYGNRKPLLLDITRPSFRKPHTEQIDFLSADWMFELIFDYGEGHYEMLEKIKPVSEHHQFVKTSASAAGMWSIRPDPFSTYRAGFEVRTYRRCHRVLMFHNFRKELGDEPYLMRSTEFDYNDLPNLKAALIETELVHKGSTRFASFIQSISQSGYVYEEAEQAYLKKSLPPLEFDYSQAIIQEKIGEFDIESLENLPQGLDGSIYQLVDLDGEGVSGILTEQGVAWFYKPNLGEGKFGAMERVATKPSLALLSGDHQQLLDLAGDGQLDVVMLDGPTPGFYERNNEQGWENFTSFRSLPNLFWKDPDLKFIDLTGDGHADVMITENEAIVWHPSLAEEGFGPAERVRKALDEERGPRLVFDDGTQSIYLSDMSGDGLVDLVRIKNGEVCYWPNLGYGNFGAKVTMDNAHWFDSPDQFDQKRVRLADIDGSGTTDIIYLKYDGVEIYFNQSGNRLSDAKKLSSLPQIDNLSSVQVADLFGNGTACLVWSSPLASDSSRPMRYIDLMGGNKPHLLISSKNNLGAETKVHYRASTKFYLKDKAEGKPWITKLSFPVHVVERVDTYDRISRNIFVSCYAYHHGYFDGIDREFRGFGMVEQWDTAEIGIEPGEILPDNTNWDAASYVPPVLTRTWFHTGAYLHDEIISKHFEGEYYHEGDPSLHEGQLDPKQREAMLLPDTIMPDDLQAEEAREACRSLKGSILRQEVYALDRRPDGTPTEESDRPYTVSERNYTIECLQPMAGNKHAVFFVHPRETIDFHYERKLYDLDGQNKNRADPRVTHNVTLEVDSFGNVLKSFAIGYGRRMKDLELLPGDREKQSHLLITYTENCYTNPIPDPKKLTAEELSEYDAYRAPLQSETRSFEIIKFEPARAKQEGMSITPLFRFEELANLVSEEEFSQSMWNVTYEDIKHLQAKDKHPYRRAIEHIRVFYRSNNLRELLPLHAIESLALIGETYKLAFTPGFFKSDSIKPVYRRERTDLPTEYLIPDPSAVLGSKGPDGGGYIDLEGNGHWWIPSGKVFYSAIFDDIPTDELDYASKHFFLPHRYQDPFHTNAISTEIFVKYDDHNLLVQETWDALGNRVTAGERDASGIKSGNDYRLLQPRLIMDPNRNRTEVAFDALGMVVGTAVRGKPEDNPQLGDQLKDTFRANLTQAEINDFLTGPRGQKAVSLLDSATSRIIYDLSCYWQESDPEKRQPAFAATIARETHASDPVPESGPKIQVSFSYSDGFGREIQKKIQAEPGQVPKRDNGKIIVDARGQPVMTDHIVSSRWVGSGWTVFNNKSKPFRQYEPFFTDRHQFEFDTKIGVSPVLFYDPVERVIATLHPNGTYEKVVFDPWHQKTYDVNDTVTFDPRTDEDINSYVAGYFQKEAPQPDDWKTWLVQRGVDPLNPPQDNSQLDAKKKAVIRTLIHADTPNVAYFDTLGRTFLTVANNKFKRQKNGVVEVVDEKFRTRVEFDIEGNQLAIRDERKKDRKLPDEPQNLDERIVMLYDYDMLSNSIHQFSMEAGERWMLNDVAGKPIRAWNSLANDLSTAYDPLRRPTEIHLKKPNVPEVLAEQIAYGEQQPNPETKNLRGKVYQLFDQAGAITSTEYDFKGNLLESCRQLAKEYKETLNWSAAPELEDETFTSSTIYDALNRPVQVTAPHSNKPGTEINLIRHFYNEANLLDRVEANLRADANATVFVENIDYNAKGQRTRIVYGSGASYGNPNPADDREGVTTTYAYDPLTFRLTHLYTIRDKRYYPDDCPQPPPADWPGCQLQNLHYTYDPAGNITCIKDEAQQTIFFKGIWVEPSAEYTYDAVYRLIEATGREHLGQINGPMMPHSHDDSPRVRCDWAANNGDLMGRYFERFSYDEAGNILEVEHSDRSKPEKPGWIRTYNYNEYSLINQGIKSNRLSSTTVGTKVDPYKHDLQGNMIYMPHLHNSNPANPDPNMHWDYKDQLHQVDTANSSPVYYAYDSTGQRVRKVVEKSPGLTEERIYLGGFEVFRRRNGAGAVTLERETLHIMDDRQRIALVETRTQGDDPAPEELIRYQLGNHLGSASLELDDQAQIISYEEYYPYGSTSYQAVRSQTETAKRYRYTGKERDEETGLYYHGARYYAPWLGRWISSDPVGISSGVNAYISVNGNPIVLSDTKGEDGEYSQYLSGVGRALVRIATLGGSVDDIRRAYRRGGGGVEGVAMAIDRANPFGRARESASEAYQRSGGGAEGVAMAIDRVNPFGQLRESASEAYQRSGGGAEGVAMAVDALNPVARVRDSGQATIEAIRRGDARGAGENLTYTLVGAASIAAPFARGAGTGLVRNTPARASAPRGRVNLSRNRGTAVAAESGMPPGWRESAGSSPRGAQFQSAATEAPTQPLRAPAARHHATRVTQRTLAREVNTVIEPGVDVASDVAAINAGQAARVNGNWVVNGRTYGLHNGTLYPIEGPGLHQLSRGTFKALGVFNQFGNTARAANILSRMGTSAVDRAAALRVFEVTRR